MTKILLLGEWVGPDLGGFVFNTLVALSHPRREPAHYRPFQAGARFCANAIGPSTKSSDLNSAATAG